jgi:hypothetical protein
MHQKQIEQKENTAGNQTCPDRSTPVNYLMPILNVFIGYACG